MTLKITPSYDDKKHSFLSLSVDSGEKKDGHLEVRTLRKLVQNMEPGRREATSLISLKDLKIRSKKRESLFIRREVC
jgi:hypothetical protein